MQKSALKDPLLGIYNFLGFKRTLEKQIKNAGFSEVVLFLIDLRDFKRLNLLLGIEKVNRLLKKIYLSIKNLVEFPATWGRFGPDILGFSFFLPEGKPLFNTVVTLANKIIDSFKNPFKVDGKLVKIDINIAISVYPYDAESAEELIEKADKALIKCKESYNQYLLYTNFLDEDVERENKALELISYAIEENRFVFFFQPYFYTKDSKLAGFEALIRIIGKNGEVISPSNFVDVLERSAYLKDFELWSLKEIKRTVDKWQKFFKTHFSIALNIAPTSFLNEDFLENLTALLQEGYGRFLTLEVTERVFVRNSQALNTSFRIIKMADPCVKIALDDFGTGVTSLKYLIDYPIDIIKIDALYVKNLLSDLKSRVIVETLVNLSKKLELKVIAEGVETQEQFEVLKSLECDIVQGFLFEKPISEEEVLRKFTE